MVILSLVVGVLSAAFLLPGCGGCKPDEQPVRSLRAMNGKAYEETICVPKYDPPPISPLPMPQLPQPSYRVSEFPLDRRFPGTRIPQFPTFEDRFPEAKRDRTYLTGKWVSEPARRRYDLEVFAGRLFERRPNGYVSFDEVTTLDFAPPLLTVSRRCQLVEAASSAKPEGENFVEVSVRLSYEVVEKPEGAVIHIRTANRDSADLHYSSNGIPNTLLCHLEFGQGDMEFLTYLKPSVKLRVPVTNYVSSRNEAWLKGIPRETLFSRP